MTKKPQRPRTRRPAEASPSTPTSGHNVFLVWSGEMSRQVAKSLYTWLRKVNQGVRPWMSEDSIERGLVWEAELLGQLGQQRIGIVCVTPENLSGPPWMLFESGAIWRSVGRSSYVCPYLLDVRPNDVQQPLSKFQATVADKSGTLALVKTISRAIEPPLADQFIEEAFDQWWEKLETALAAIPRQTPAPVARTAEQVLEEILTLTRSQDRALDQLVKWAVRTDHILTEIKTANPRYATTFSGFADYQPTTPPIAEKSVPESPRLSDLLNFGGPYGIPPVPSASDVLRSALEDMAKNNPPTLVRSTIEAIAKPRIPPPLVPPKKK